MKLRRLLWLLALLALLAPPLGHMRANAHAAAALTGPCHTPSVPGKADRAAIDCAIACAALLPADLAAARLTPIVEDEPDQAGLSSFAGIWPEADPPPPRPA